MSIYRPDVWVILELSSKLNTHRRVFAGWYGGFAGANSWQLNSGILETRLTDGYWEFIGHSGSIYYCHPSSYKMSTLMQGVLESIKESASVDGLSIRVLDIDELTDTKYNIV